MRRLALVTLFSGGGRTILNLLDRIESGELDAHVPLAITNRECAGIERLEARDIAVLKLPWTRETSPEDCAARAWPRIEAADADLVLNCGFLRLLHVPPEWLGRVLNIHPALLPRFGGKGMYGHHVHRAVLAAGEAESGCTVHFTTNEYDAGPVILQRRVPVLPDDTPDTLADRVFERELIAFPEAINLFAAGRLSIEGGKVVIQ